VFTSPPGGSIDPNGALKNSFPLANIVSLGSHSDPPAPSGTFTSPLGSSWILLEMWGAGGGGGGGNVGGGGGGGAGAYISELIPVDAVNGTAFSYTIGAAGTAGPINTIGGNGGSSSFGGRVAPGGSGGAAADGSFGAGGAGGGPTINGPGGFGAAGQAGTILGVGGPGGQTNSTGVALLVGSGGAGGNGNGSGGLAGVAGQPGFIRVWSQ
jgi:hypothetical protein